MTMMGGVPFRAPQPVRTAAVLLHLVAFAVLVEAGLSVYRASAEMSHLTGDEDTLPGFAEELRTTLWYGVAVQTVFLLVLTAGLFVLARYLLRRYQAARVVTWVVAGAGIVTCGVVASSLALFGSIFAGTDFGFTSYGDLDELDLDEWDAYAFGEPLPGWLEPTEMTLSIVVLLLLFAIAVLLAVPAANRYFWQPPRWLGWPPGYGPPPPPAAFGPPPMYPAPPGASPPPGTFAPQPAPFAPPAPASTPQPEPTIVDTPDPAPEPDPDRRD